MPVFGVIILQVYECMEINAIRVMQRDMHDVLF